MVELKLALRVLLTGLDETVKALAAAHDDDPEVVQRLMSGRLLIVMDQHLGIMQVSLDDHIIDGVNIDTRNPALFGMLASEFTRAIEGAQRN